MGKTEDASPLMLGKRVTEGGEEGGPSLHHPASWGTAPPPYSTIHFIFPGVCTSVAHTWTGRSGSDGEQRREGLAQGKPGHADHIA